MNTNNYLYVTQYNVYVKTPFDINGHRVIAIINSGAIGNFMSFVFIQQNNIQIKKIPIRIGNNRRVVKNGKRENNAVTNVNSTTQ